MIAIKFYTQISYQYSNENMNAALLPLRLTYEAHQYFRAHYGTLACGTHGAVVHCCRVNVKHLYLLHRNRSAFSPLFQQSVATWETENKIYCKQTIVEGDGPKTYWTRELNGDELILVRTVVNTYIYI